MNDTMEQMIKKILTSIGFRLGYLLFAVQITFQKKLKEALMTISQRRTQNSIQFLGIDSEDQQKIREGTRKLAGSYEFKLVEEHYFVAVEFYVAREAGRELRAMQIQEILDAMGLKQIISSKKHAASERQTL